MRLPGLPARLGFAWLAACKTLASKHSPQNAGRQPAFLSLPTPRSVIGIVVTVQHSQTFERKALSRTYGRAVARSLRAAMTRRRITILLLACNTRALRITRRQAGAAAALGLAGPARAVEEVRSPRPLAYRILKGDPPLMQPYDCLLYTSPSPRDQRGSRMPSSA